MIKESKEKEEQADIYKDKTKKDEERKVTPSLTNSKGEKTKNFTPKLTSDETNIKKNSFTPSNEPSKKEKTRNFTPNTIADPKKKPRNFSPTLELKENIGKNFKPELNEKQAISRQRKKYTIKDMKMIAKEKGGDCLSQKYINNKTNLRWQCSKGHEWNATPKNVKNHGTWCPECSSNKLTIKEMQELAKSRGGKCLSEKYIGNHNKLKWQCSKGHEWEAAPNHIKNSGTWCPKCASPKKLSIKEMQELAKSRGGKCLSKEYTNAHGKLKWQCSNGHEWEAVSHSIKNQGSWCPKCAGNQKHTINDLRELAKSRGGKCLTEKYLGIKENHQWRCNKGHEWEATPDNVKNNKSWCPNCSEGTEERITRQFFEALYNNKFKKAYPPWLLSPKGNKMHLDGYNKELKLAFEQQGSQHYIFNQFLHKTKERFLRLQKHDKLKAELCKQHGVHLMAVPYTVKVEEREKFIRSEAKILGIKAPMNPNKIDYSKFRYNTEDKLKKMQDLAISRGGKLLSKKYLNAITKLDWQCEKGHTWKASPNNIKNNAKGRGGLKGNWCPDCVQRRKYTIKDVKKVARDKGGECLSKIYERSQGKLTWKCKNDHEFDASFYNVKNKNSWCPECKNEDTLHKYKNIAINKGGQCLSDKYKGVHSKLRWKCDKDHEWRATPNSIYQGSWCPECVGQHKYTISHMKSLAESFGGDCLSEKYLGAKVHLEWRCSEGHKWEATPNNIKNNKMWCPKCKKETNKH